MIIPKNIIAFIVAATIGCLANAETRSNNMALPSELYMLPESRNDLFTQSFLQKWNPYDFHVRVDGDCDFERRIPTVTTIVNPASHNYVKVDLISGDDFGVICSDTIRLLVKALDLNSISPVSAQIIGDSFVQGSFYRTALVDSMLVPGLKTIGLRKLSGSDSHYDEGRGGWTMKDYFSIPKGDFTPYSGFMQPNDDRRYLGACQFWINCHKVQNGELSDFESRYQCGRFEDFSRNFDAMTGLPKHPVKNDLMWDGKRQSYICYDGRKWHVLNNVDESEWSFNYPKYLAIWNLDAPDFLFETLGLNDFRDELNVDYSEWDRMVAIMKDSYLRANPEGKFAIVIPCSSCGSMYNRRGDFTARQNMCMWKFRKHLIDRFDNRKDEGFYLVDMGITIDNENGYKVDNDGLQTGNPHPYPNYPQMGQPLAAFIQYYRK